MSRMNFVVLAMVFVLFSGIVSAYTDLGGGFCGCNNCTDCSNALQNNVICDKEVIANGSDMSPITGDWCINASYALSNFSNKVFDLNGTTLIGAQAADYGIYVNTSNLITIQNGRVQGFARSGIYLLNVTNSTVRNVAVNETATAPVSGAGIFLGAAGDVDPYDSNTQISNVNVTDNGPSTSGIFLSGCDENEIYNADLSRNGYGGMLVYASKDNNIHDSVANNNSEFGFECIMPADFPASGNTFLRVNASDNNGAGLAASRCHNSVINQSRFYSNTYGVYSTLSAQGVPPSHNLTVSNNYFEGNDYGIYVSDILSDQLSLSTFSNNWIHFSLIAGVYLNNTRNNTLLDNNITDCPWCLVVRNSPNTTIEDTYITGTNGFEIENSTNIHASNTHLVNPGYGLFVSSDASSAQNVYLYNLIFDRLLGGYVDYTNLSIVDSVEAGAYYGAEWVLAYSTPADTLSFENKFVNISGTTASIDQLVWHWEDSELPGYIESQLELWENSSGVWTQMNSTPDTSSNTLALYGLNPASDYAILQNLSACPVITTSDAYQLQADLVGAPNAVPDLVDYACVVIATSNVYLDCNGFDITNNGTANAAGIIINGSVSLNYDNITIENCPSISQYEVGLYSVYSDNESITNVTSHDNTDAGFLVSAATNATLELNNASSNGGEGFWLSYLNYSNFTSLNAYNNTASGFYTYRLTGNAFDSCHAYNNTDNGFWLSASGDTWLSAGNTFAGSMAWENGESGFYVLDSYNNEFIFTSAFNNTQSGIFLENSENGILNHTTLFNNMYDFRVSGSLAGLSTYVSEDTLFLNPLGTFVNYTNLSISDSCEWGKAYSINWTTNSSAPLEQAISFEQKFVNITNLSGIISIDEIVWHWDAAEEAVLPYTPLYFNLLQYNSVGGWELVNGTPDITGRTLSAYALNPASDYGILQYAVNTSILKLDQTADQPSPGGIVEFNITINNTGNITLNPVQVIDELPVGLIYLNADPPYDLIDGQNLTWNNVGPLAPGAVTTILLNATVDDGVVDNVTRIANLTNYVNVTGTAGEEAFGEDYENATVYYANVSAVKTDITALPPSPGGMVEYQITIENTGEVDLSPVLVVDTLPAQFTYNATNTTPVTVVGSTVNWTIGPLAAGASQVILLNATVNAGTLNGTYNNTIAVTATPPNGDDVTAFSDVGVGVGVPAIDVVKTSSDYIVTIGDKFTFNLSITNTGTINITVWAQDVLPAQLAYVVGEANPAPTSVVGQTLYWNAAFANVSPGQTVNITYNVTAVGAAGSLQNAVLVTGVPPNGDNVTDTAFVNLNSKYPPEEDTSLKPLEIEVEQPAYVGDDVTITVTTTGGDPVNHASLTVYEFGDYFEGYTDSDGEFIYVPDYAGTHWAAAEKSGYTYSGKEYFEVLALGECVENSDCIELYGDCYMCSKPTESAADNTCVLRKGAQCGSKDSCGEEDATCTDCTCENVECLTDEDCAEGQECIDNECVGGEQPPEGCTSDSDCADTQFCSGGDCLSVPCGCGIVTTHQCTPYECCSDADCPAGTCNSATHECEQQPPIGNKTLEVDTPGTNEVGKDVTINVTSDGKPISGAQVTIIINGKSYGAGTTDANGQTTFRPQEAGQYFVEATKEGFANGEDDFKASSPGLSLMQIATMILAPLMLLALLAILYMLFFAKKKKRKQKEDSED